MKCETGYKYTMMLVKNLLHWELRRMKKKHGKYPNLCIQYKLVIMKV